MDMWQQIEDIESKVGWERQDIDTLVYYIELLAEANDSTAVELGRAFERLVELNKRLDFYRNITTPKLLSAESN